MFGSGFKAGAKLVVFDFSIPILVVTHPVF